MQDLDTHKCHAAYTAHFTPIQPSSAPAFTAEAAERLYSVGLRQAAQTASASITVQNRQRRMQLGTELAEFLSRMPHQRSLMTCIPEDLLVFLQLEFLPRHAGIVLPDGDHISAPSSVNNAISHLSMIFKELGRGSYWNAQLRAGNLATSHQISQWSSGYEKASHQAGFVPT